MLPIRLRKVTSEARILAVGLISYTIVIRFSTMIGDINRGAAVVRGDREEKADSVGVT